MVSISKKRNKRSSKKEFVTNYCRRYRDVLIYGLKVFPKIPVKLRDEGKKIIEKIGPKKFYDTLKARNKTCVYHINPNDKIRLLRSWEIYKVSNKSIYEINKENKMKKLDSYNFYKILIFPPRKFVYLSCKKRWYNMIKLGAIKEVKLLMKKEKKSNKKNLIKTIGFKELKDFLLKKNNMNKTSELALQATRNYAKRQCTWFRHQFKADIILKKKYEKNIKKLFLKEIEDKLLTN